jgi:glycosyltransferase involved in cell wall biosynthesis
MAYSIIIPIHNEGDSLPTLLDELKAFGNDNEIIIIDDGSDDGSDTLLKQCSYISLIQFSNNYGKGKAICAGVEKATHEQIILFDGDLELNLQEISKFMILNKTERIHVVFGTRLDSMNPLQSILDFGNFFLNGFFNLIHQSNFTDVLCGCKAFHKSDLNFKSLQSVGFDIDVEIASNLVSKNMLIIEIPITYNRRSSNEGKKLKISDGWKILKRMIFNKNK